MSDRAITVTTKTSGPLFNGSARRIIADLGRDATQAVGQAVISELHFKMDRSFKNPTPYYETQVVMDRSADSIQIHDRGVVYGPWLEGTSSRNRTTRFKGYMIWRRTFQEINAKVDSIISQVVDRQVRRLRG
jgi:hypothetical protein